MLPLLLVGCSSSESKIAAAVQQADQALTGLKQALDGNQVRNATIVTQYVSVMKNSRPELAPLLSELQKEATTQSPVYQNLNSRFLAARDGTESFPSWIEQVDELSAIAEASSVAMYNDALSDTVNVIADLSGGELARVNAVSREAEQMMNGESGATAGNQYIGNPNYGYWSQGSGGSFWAWYGQYAFFSSLFGGQRHYYHDWSGRRGYSYYHDVGRNNYTSRAQRSSQQALDVKTQKQFGRRGGYQSPYAKPRAGASGLSRARTARQKSLFQSQYSNKSSASKFQSSTRNSGFRTSGGVRRGK